MQTNVPSSVGYGCDSSNDWVTCLWCVVGGIGWCDLYEFVGSGDGSSCGGDEVMILDLDLMFMLIFVVVAIVVFVVVIVT